MENAGKSKEQDGLGGSVYELLNSKTYNWETPVLKKFLALWVQDPMFLGKYRRFCKAIFFIQDDMYYVAEQILKHFDENLSPPDKVMLVQRLLMLNRFGHKKFDLDAAAAVAKAIYSVKIVGNKETLKDWMLSFAKVEQTKTVAKRVLEFLREGRYDDIIEINTQLAHYYRVSDFEDIDGGFVEDSLDADLIKRNIRATQRIPSGVVALDKCLGGGFGLGQVYMVAGGTGVGKTTAVLNFCRGAVHAGEKALFITTEMQRLRLIDKYHASITGIPVGLQQIEHESDLKQKMMDYLKSKQELFWIADFGPNTGTMLDVKKYIEEKLWDKENFHPKLIIIDTPDLLLPSRNFQKSYEGFADIYANLFAMAGKYDVALIVTSDVKMPSRDKLLVGVTDVGGGYEKPKKVDGFFGLGRDRDRMKIDPETGCFKIWFNIDKLRTDGFSGMVLEIEVAPHLGKWCGISTVPHEQVMKEIGYGPKEDSSGKKKNEYR